MLELVVLLQPLLTCIFLPYNISDDLYDVSAANAGLSEQCVSYQHREGCEDHWPGVPTLSISCPACQRGACLAWAVLSLLLFAEWTEDPRHPPLSSLLWLSRKLNQALPVVISSLFSLGMSSLQADLSCSRSSRVMLLVRSWRRVPYSAMTGVGRNKGTG